MLFRSDLNESIIYIADDAAEWPPYVYYERNGSQKTENIVGFTVDLIDLIFSEHGIEYKIDLLPWARALLEVEMGQTYKMILGANYSEERAEKYYVSNSIYQTTGYFFYSKKNNPNGLNIIISEDLNNYIIGGIIGYNYSPYNISNDYIYNRTRNHDLLVKMLHENRFDVFLENIEVLQGFCYIENICLLDTSLGYEKIIDLPPTNFHILFTKDSIGLALKNIVDEGLEKLKKSGEYYILYQKYFY